MKISPCITTYVTTLSWTSKHYYRSPFWMLPQKTLLHAAASSSDGDVSRRDLLVTTSSTAFGWKTLQPISEQSRQDLRYV